MLKFTIFIILEIQTICPTWVLCQVMVERALIRGNGIEVVAVFVEGSTVYVVVVVDIAVGILGQEEFLADFINLSCFGAGLSCAFGIKHDIGLAIASEIVAARSFEVHACNRLVDAIACFPAYEIVETETFFSELDGTFAADFQDDTFIAACYVRVTRFRRRQVAVGVGIGIS